jgi:hypothetical protein
MINIAIHVVIITDGYLPSKLFGERDLMAVSINAHIKTATYPFHQPIFLTD